MKKSLEYEERVAMSLAPSPYGDGYACVRIADALGVARG